jgi:ribosome-binding protein aMBF1 (putative translation factor)
MVKLNSKKLGKTHCYKCGRKLTKKERDSYVDGYPFKVCDDCAVKP